MQVAGARFAYDVLRGPWRQGEAYVFTFIRTSDADEEHPDAPETHTVAVAALPAFLPLMTITRAFDPVTTGAPDVPRLLIESDDFNRAFTVRARDQRRALEVMSPSFAQHVMRLRPRHVVIGDDALLVSQEGRASVPVREQMWSLVTSLADALPDRLIGESRVGTYASQMSAAEAVALRAVAKSSDQLRGPVP